MINQEDKSIYALIQSYSSYGEPQWACLEIEMPDVDFPSFKTLDNHYAKDKDNAYYYNYKVKNVDVGTFQLINDFYTKDKNNIYCDYPTGGVIGELANVDYNTFEVTGEKSGKDKNNFYVNCDIKK